MAPKRNLSAKDAPGKKKARKSIMLEQKIDILRRYDRGESTAAIRNVLNPFGATRRTIRHQKKVNVKGLGRNGIFILKIISKYLPVG